jgi:hypothetical protein
VPRLPGAGRAAPLGTVDLWLQRALPYPWAGLANSSAVWALAAYGLGLWVRGSWWLTGAVGAGLLVIAVPAYYLAAALFLHDDMSLLWAPTSLLWMAFGVVAGVVFGVAAAWARYGGWRQVVGVAMPAAVLFAEALVGVLREGDAAYRSDQRQAAIIELALGVLVVVVVGQTARRRIAALASAIPLALMGFIAFRAGGF